MPMVVTHSMARDSRTSFAAAGPAKPAGASASAAEGRTGALPTVGTSVPEAGGGFGSLDPETLQAVLAELGRLQAGGRTVGIVSHVEELRRQIPDRIEVARAPSGSTLRITAS